MGNNRGWTRGDIIEITDGAGKRGRFAHTAAHRLESRNDY